MTTILCVFLLACSGPRRTNVVHSLADMLFSYLAVGLGIDPRQQTLFGPYLGPALVGLAFGMWASATTNIAPGFTGANGNPARALAVAIAGDNWACKVADFDSSLRAKNPFSKYVNHSFADRHWWQCLDHWIWWVGPVGRPRSGERGPC
jgi:hypothetical protein